MWTILALTIVFYGIDFLVIRGHVVLEGGFRFRWVSGNRIHLQLAQGDNEEERAARQMATQLLLSVPVPPSIHNLSALLTFFHDNSSSYPIVSLQAWNHTDKRIRTTRAQVSSMVKGKHGSILALDTLHPHHCVSTFSLKLIGRTEAIHLLG